MRKREITVAIITSGQRKTLAALQGRRLKELFSDAGITFSLPCGGNGRCGKCAVTFRSGAPRATALDQHFFSEKELKAGKRLLCRCVLEEDCEIELDAALGAGEDRMVIEAVERYAGKRAADCESFGIAIDIGTTTIAAALIGKDKDDKCYVISDKSCVNHQRSYGTDVISRIEAVSDPDKKAELQRLIRDDLIFVIKSLLEDNVLSGKELSQVVITGNTTMLHILRGYDVSGLGKYPYKTGNIRLEELTIKELLGEDIDIDGYAYILPGISAFVGADVVSGLYFLDFLKKKEKALFMDLGTNGEMAFYDGKELTVASSAAGPVFEGGGISCGVASVPGAICHVTIDKKRARCETIGGEKPVGICGTGVLEAVSELRRNGIIDSEGLLGDDFFEPGFLLAEDADGNPISITQEDIRNVQLAKAAIRAGLKELLSGQQPEVIYIAGGFGAGMDIQKIRHLKLFPTDYCDKIIVVGNTSLKGAIKYLKSVLAGKESGERAELTAISESARECILAAKEGFDESYIEALGF